ncbi:hypothetical protein P7K49_000721 [Saguinus oedipus]|uniref:Uncharacterized protein n=1 Tax=Saguinus oedipus TaxID=9490 RepID=A0ABQ9WCY6_SAGOE|nr:hypothetical protein P7K49_000721 [Saguinus oedipus]
MESPRLEKDVPHTVASAPSSCQRLSSSEEPGHQKDSENLPVFRPSSELGSTQHDFDFCSQGLDLDQGFSPG